jgi:hypothetical protein
MGNSCIMGPSVGCSSGGDGKYSMTTVTGSLTAGSHGRGGARLGKRWEERD